MKKLLMSVAVAMMAVASQAAIVKWATANNLSGIDIASVDGNAAYSAGGIDMKGNSALTFVLAIYETGTENLVDSMSGAVKYGTTNKKVSNSATLANVALNTTYDYVLTITGTQNDLTGIIGDWDYTDATLTATMSGSFKTASSGTSQLTLDPTTWTVAGAVEAIPEPTSAMLLLLGMAGLALKRKQA